MSRLNLRSSQLGAFTESASVSTSVGSLQTALTRLILSLPQAATVPASLPPIPAYDIEPGDAPTPQATDLQTATVPAPLPSSPSIPAYNIEPADAPTPHTTDLLSTSANHPPPTQACEPERAEVELPVTTAAHRTAKTYRKLARMARRTGTVSVDRAWAVYAQTNGDLARTKRILTGIVPPSRVRFLSYFLPNWGVC